MFDEDTENLQLLPGASLLHEPGGGHFSACLAWAEPDEIPYGYVDGYRHAAELIFEPISKGLWLDTLVFPFMFVWRHAIELQLKGIIATGKELRGEAPSYRQTHKLTDLWKLACEEPAVQAMGGFPETPTVTSVLKELEQIDPKAEGFRYHETPVPKQPKPPTQFEKTLLGPDGQPVPGSRPSSPGSGQWKLDLRNAHSVLSGVSDFLARLHKKLSKDLTEHKKYDSE